MAGRTEKTALRERFEALIEKDPTFSKSSADYNLSRPERYQRAMRKQRRLWELCAELGLTSDADRRLLRICVHDDLGTDLQALMFIPNLEATFSEEQLAHWLPRARSWEIIGCYA